MKQFQLLSNKWMTILNVEVENKKRQRLEAQRKQRAEREKLEKQKAETQRRKLAHKQQQDVRKNKN